MDTVTITLDFPGKNALGSVSMNAIIDALRAANDRPVLLRGAGAFSAGLDLREVAALDAAKARPFLDLLERCMVALYLHPAPTVACIEGHAIAGGAILALCCDHAVVREDPSIRIGLNETALGVPFPPRIFSIVRRRLAPHAIDEVVLGAGLHAPASALRLGLVHEIAADAAAAAEQRITALGRHPRAAYAETKRALRGDAEGLCSTKEQAAMLDAFTAAWTSDSVKARLAAVLRK